MLFFKPRPKEKFKYLPTFNSAKFFGEKKRKNLLDNTPVVKVFKPTKTLNNNLINKDIRESEESIKAQSLHQIDLTNLRQFPGLFQAKFLDRIVAGLDGMPDEIYSNFINLFAPASIISTLKKILILISVSVIALISYLAFIDTNFIVTEWDFEYSPNSYLDKAKSRELQEFLQSQRLAGIFPNNHLLFLDGTNMQLTIKSKFPEITKLEIMRRDFPSRAKLLISTEPVLATLIIKINSKNEFWRIDNSGNILSQDNHNLLSNPIYIDKEITFNKGTGRFDQTDFFGSNLEQLDKLYTINFAKELVSNFDLRIAKVTIPSLSPADKNFTIHLDNQVKLIFNSHQFDKKSIQERVQKVLNSQLIDQIKNSKIQYIDMRVAHRVYVG